MIKQTFSGFRTRSIQILQDISQRHGLLDHLDDLGDLDRDLLERLIFSPTAKLLYC